MIILERCRLGRASCRSIFLYLWRIFLVIEWALPYIPSLACIISIFLDGKRWNLIYLLFWNLRSIYWCSLLIVFLQLWGKVSIFTPRFSQAKLQNLSLFLLIFWSPLWHTIPKFILLPIWSQIESQWEYPNLQIDHYWQE
jgi:hypothetical protein